MKKTIWYISKYASPLKYGFASRHFYLSKEFNVLGYNSIVITSDSNHVAHFPKFKKIYNREYIEGVETFFIKTLKYKGSLSLKRILSWVDFEVKLFFMPKKKLSKPDVIIVSSLSLLTIINGFFLKKKFKAKLVFEIRDIWPLTIIETGRFQSSNLFVKVLALIERFGYKQSDVIIGTMPNLSEHVEKILGFHKKCYCIPQGVDNEVFSNPEPLPREYIDKYIPKNKFIIGYAGSIGRTNALETIIEASRLLSHNKKIHFLFVGEGDFLDYFQSKTKDLKNVTFAPKIKKTQVQTFLQHCNILYDSVKTTILYDYGLSRNKWIDYFYAAKPLIVSYSGYKSMINEADCGTFIPSENIDKLMETIILYSKMSEEEIETIGEKGKKWLIQNRTFARLASEYVRLL